VEYARTIQFTIQDTGVICNWLTAPAITVDQVTANPTGTALIENVRAHPGALWLIGNEPDSIYNGSPIQAELYAELYHHFYTTIRAADPTAKVGPGAIVQPSPLRMEYLDKILDHYQARYGERLPSDVWNIHLYILNEGTCGEWGATVPPFSRSERGWSVPFTPATLLDVAALQDHLRTFRQWMHDRGYGDRPLIITEYGVLPPPTYSGFEDTVAAQFLNDTFQMFLSATDPAVGYAADGGRLVQFWAWFSTDYEPPPGWTKFGGDLFETGSVTLTVIGQAFKAQAEAHRAAYIDLVSVPLVTPTIPAGHVGPIDVLLRVRIDNRGNAAAPTVPARFEMIDYATGAVLSQTNIVLGPAPARYSGTSPQADAGWRLSPGTLYTLAFELDPARTLTQTRRSTQRLEYPAGWAADLALAAMTIDVAPNIEWQAPLTTTITGTVLNAGNWTADASAVRVRAVRANQVVVVDEVVGVPALPPGASIDVTATLPLTAPGYYVVTLSVEYEGVDRNQQNNSAQCTIMVAGNRLYLPIVLRNPF
jgi:hypothetical protein